MYMSLLISGSLEFGFRRSRAMLLPNFAIDIRACIFSVFQVSYLVLLCVMVFLASTRRSTALQGLPLLCTLRPVAICWALTGPVLQAIHKSPQDCNLPHHEVSAA